MHVILLFYKFAFGIIYFAEQVRHIRQVINKAAATDVLCLDRIQPTYIFIDDPRVQEELEAGYVVFDNGLTLSRIQRWIQNKVKESFLFRNIMSYKHNVAWNLLRLAQDENHGYRTRAVRALASLNNLTDADYQQLAQACDLRTTMSLARSTKNIKFFLDPPYYKRKPDRKSLIKHLHEYLAALDGDAEHPCLHYFITKIFAEHGNENKSFDDDLTGKGSLNEHIPVCLEALHHHSRIGINAKFMVTLGGLPLLMEVFKYLKQVHQDTVDNLIMLSRTISNMSVHGDLLQDFYNSGWVKVLVMLSQHSDIRVAGPAQRALANLDVDDNLYGGGLKFYRRIYQLYPTERVNFQPKLDVVFVHGLLGGLFITWRQRDLGEVGPKSPFSLLGIFTDETDRLRLETQVARHSNMDDNFIMDMDGKDTDENIHDNDLEIVMSDLPVDANRNFCGGFYSIKEGEKCATSQPSRCWPKDWLAEDCPNIRIMGVNYETNISLWNPICPKLRSSRTLQDRSTGLLRALTKAGVGRRPIVWVSHSMGGLIVKGMLIQASESSDPEKKALYTNTKGIVFYSTPHKGSHLATLTQPSQIILWPSIEVQELRENSPGLLQLHEKFLDLVEKTPLKVLTFAERNSTYVTSMKFEVRFVDAISADPDIGEMYGIPLDHLSICKPACKQSFLYQKVLTLIKEVLTDVYKPFCAF
ncbi:UNVERIFIED_CONTAM: hypothetical protein PYX00_007265 [Menopon gallinae]|uniref:Protein SERAC1 n=1 Tax=Menopon gallinae TaxID=328185 RepID=A0AAW2HIM1_9NEOP